MFKRFICMILAISLMLAAIPTGIVFAEEPQTTEISNQYLKVVVNNKNGGYVISTLEGDILKKSDNNAFLTHRGENYDTSFTSFKVGADEYVFGEKYGLFGLGSSNVTTELDVNGNYIKSTWSVGDFEVEQNISIVNNDASEQLGTALINYTVRNNSTLDKEIKSRILIDTQLGENDYGYYELPKQHLGQGYKYFEFERTWDSSLDPTVIMPSDYFVRDNPYSSNIVGYGVNSVFTEQKPYKMTFAHWSNIAATVFDYEPDETLNFTNKINEKLTADSAAALYYNLGTIAAGKEKSFSTYYGVTANLKNKDNKIIVNTTAPSKLEFKDDSRTIYEGSDGMDNIVRINVNLTNPQYLGKDYDKLAVVVYALGFGTQRRTDSGTWIEYDNADPIYTNMVNFKSGDNEVTYFDFKFEPKERAQLGTFVIKLFDMDESVNELGHYAEEFCLATTENHIILPGRDASLPAITLTGMAPDIIYNKEIRYITVSGQGVSFFRSDLLEKIYLYGENGNNYEISIENLLFEQGDEPQSVSIMLEEEMEPGRYQLHFLWKSNTGVQALDGVPLDFTSEAMFVQVSSDERYNNAYYGIATVQRNGSEKYKVVAYKNESEFQKANIDEDDLLLAFRGDILQDKQNKNLYRLFGKDKDVNISYILNYHGDDLSLEEKSDGSVAVLMDGKLTTVGANTTVRKGTAAFRFNSGTEYIIPEYDERGIVQENGELSGNKDFIKLKWDNALDTLTTIGGFLIDLKYGILGKIQNADGTKSDIISFGGGLDLGFMTPGGAAIARQNTAEGRKWTTKYTGEDETVFDDSKDGMSFGIDFDEENGNFITQTKEIDVEPTNKSAKRVSAGATIHDVLYGGQNPGYLGINMEAYISMPQIVSALPEKFGANLAINTIGGYQVGVDGELKTQLFEGSFSLVIKSSPTGAPIPDKLYITIGGFEPGFNIDGMGIVFITGGGGGIDNLYDTIYGKDGIPPLTILLHVELDITKILTGSADLELSLRSIKLSVDDLSLKKYKDAKFVDGGEIGIGWYPNFNFNFSAGVTFHQIMRGRLTITAAAGSDIKDFIEFVLNVSLQLPKYIPIVGGMQLASAELGGGSEKVWGSVELIEVIKVGFVYYWGGEIEFSHGNPSGSQNLATMSATDDRGVRRAKLMYNEMLEPVEIGADPESGEKQFLAVGSNLSFVTASTLATDFDERVNNLSNLGTMRGEISLRGGANTEILTNNERTSHLVNFGESCDYILSVSRADGSDFVEEHIKEHMTVKKDNAAYELRYYVAPANDASDEEKMEALRNANVNIAGNKAYIVIPKANAAGSLLIEFSDNNAYDVSAIKVNPIGTLTSCNAQLNGNILSVTWDGDNISDSAEIIISATDGNDENNIVLNEDIIKASSGSADIVIPEKMASGEYRIKVTMSDENISYDTYDAGNVLITNNQAPEAAQSIAIENCGDDKLKVTVVTDEENFAGYLVEVYEDGKLVDTGGLYFAKGEEIIVGGRYEMPVMDENGNPTGDTLAVGYTPGKEYTAKVRLCNIVEDAEGNEIYHCSAYKISPKVTLIESTKPSIQIEYNNNRREIKVTSDVPIIGELYINAATDDGEWYDFADTSREFTQRVNLPDGEHTIEFHAEDAEGDHAIVSQIISIDITPPVVLIASPISGACFDGDSISVTATADQDAEYTFKINGNLVLPDEDDIFASGMMSCTLPLNEAKNFASIELEIIARDQAGNETTKTLTLINRKITEITSISISSDKEIEKGKLTLAEGESAELRVLGMAGNERIDITDLSATSLEVMSGRAASFDGKNVTADFAGQMLIRAGFALGGNDSLYDGLVVEVSDDETLDYSKLEERIEKAKQIKNKGYTNKNWNRLQNAIEAAEQIMSTEGVTQSDIDRALTALDKAIADLTNTPAFYSVSFNSNGGSAIESQKIESGLRVIEPEDPVKEGYIFGGWYLDRQLSIPYNFDKSVKESFTLYAKWIKKEEPKPDRSFTDFWEILITDDEYEPTLQIPFTDVKYESEWVNPFIDVEESDWFYNSVKYVHKNGLMKGVSDTEFAPKSIVTRGMFVTVIYRMENEPLAGVCSFADVESGSYYEKAVAWASAKGIVKGMSDTEFAPNNSITREQMATIIYRYAKFKGYNTAIGEATDIFSYDDYGMISEYAIEAIKYAVGSRIMTGRTESTFDPIDKTMRSEMATVFMRMPERMK